MHIVNHSKLQFQESFIDFKIEIQNEIRYWFFNFDVPVQSKNIKSIFTISQQPSSKFFP